MKIILRRVLRIALLFSVFIGFLPLSLWWLVNDAAASHWLLQQLVSQFPEQISATILQGKLRDGIRLENVQFHNETQNIQLKHAVIHWQLDDLTQGLLKINSIKLDGMEVVLAKSAEESQFDPLAKIDLPLNLELDNFLLTHLTVKQQESRYQIDRLQFSAATQDNQLFLHSLTVAGQGVTATLTGQTKIGEGFPFRANLAWQFSSPAQGKWQGVVTASGNSQTVNFNHQLLTPFLLQQQGKLTDLMLEPQLTTSGHWQNLHWPLRGKIVQIASKQGSFNLSGSAKKYQLQLQAQLKQTEQLQGSVQFSGDGTAQTLHIAQLNVLSKLGRLLVNGDVGWQKNPQFELQASGEHFNPALMMPDFPGDLNFKTHLKGQLLAEKLQLAIEIAHLNGKLRNYPVQAQGQLNLVDEQLEIKSFALTSGANKFSAQGKLGEKNARLEIAIAAPQLHSLWPTLAGQLNAKAHLEGALTHPNLLLTATGKQLHFEQYAVKNLALNVNYAADDKKNSAIQLNADGLSSGVNNVAKLSLSGQGTKAQHRFTAQINAEQGDVNLALNGSLQGKLWQARLSELQLHQPQAGRWQLQKPALLSINQQATGVDVALSESCFAQANASVCVQGHYPAQGHFDGEIHAQLPSELAKPYLPKDFKFAGRLSIDGKVTNNNTGLTGNYQLTLSKNSTVAVMIDKELTTIPVNELLLTGTLQGTKVNSSLNLLFGGKNYLRGQLNLDTNTTQAISGQFSAAIMDFTPLMPYILPLSDLKGTVTAAVTVAGTLKKPALLGNVALNNAAVSVEQAGIRLEDINLKLQALAANPEQIVINGTAKSGAGHLNLTGKVQLQPILGYPAQLLISGSDFEVVKIPKALITISPQLTCNYANHVGAITGKLTVAKAQIQLEELPTNAAVPSEDEQIIGEEKPEQLATAPATKIGVDIAIDLGKQTHFVGLGLKTDVVGSLRLRQKDDNLVLFGTVDMQKARYKSYGQDLTVRRGRFVFNGSSTNPTIDVEAIRLSKSQKVTAILKLTGSLKNPQTQISTEPSLPDSDALAYLITGKALNQATKSDGNLLASAALSYGAGKVAWIAEKFGIDEFELQEGATMKESLVAIGQYLTPDFYVGAKVGLFSKQTIVTLKYKITDKLSISTQSGESQRIYLNYEFSHK